MRIRLQSSSLVRTRVLPKAGVGWAIALKESHETLSNWSHPSGLLVLGTGTRQHHQAAGRHLWFGSGNLQLLGWQYLCTLLRYWHWYRLRRNSQRCLPLWLQLSRSVGRHNRRQHHPTSLKRMLPDEL